MKKSKRSGTMKGTNSEISLRSMQSRSNFWKLKRKQLCGNAKSLETSLERLLLFRLRESGAIASRADTNLTPNALSLEQFKNSIFAGASKGLGRESNIGS